MMTEENVRKRAAELLSELTQLDALATSPLQRREFKDAREQLQRAIDTGSDAALHLGSYWFAAVSEHVREVQDAKRKGAERTIRRGRRDGDSA